MPAEGSFFEASNLISGNRRDGVAFEGGSRGERLLVNSFIGSDITGQVPASNGRYGVFVGGNSGLRDRRRFRSRVPATATSLHSTPCRVFW